MSAAPQLEALLRTVQELKAKLAELGAADAAVDPREGHAQHVQDAQPRAGAGPAGDDDDGTLGANGRDRHHHHGANGAAMSAEVHAGNPYSRLMALQTMNVVPDYEKIRGCSVMVVGLGGIGATAAEMLARCGVGKLLLFDYDSVEVANMNRMFFRPEHVGRTKTEAAKEVLEAINPDVEYEHYTYDVTLMDNWEHFLDRVQRGGVDGASPVTLVLSCVDNYAARLAVNQACTELDLPWMESGVSESATSGHIQFMLPGRTACFACVPPLAVADGRDESSLKREGVCAASLPTTMGVVSSLLVQNALKFMLGFGQISYYLSYDVLGNFFPCDIVQPNPECVLESCLLRQQEYYGHWQPEEWASAHAADAEPVVHANNDWGIELSEDADAPSAKVQENYGYPAPHQEGTGDAGDEVTQVGAHDASYAFAEADPDQDVSSYAAQFDAAQQTPAYEQDEHYYEEQDAYEQADGTAGAEGIWHEETADAGDASSGDGNHVGAVVAADGASEGEDDQSFGDSPSYHEQGRGYVDGAAAADGEEEEYGDGSLQEQHHYDAEGDLL